jgi:hypothetical protein
MRLPCVGAEGWNIQTPYFYVLSNSLRCFSSTVWEHLSRCTKWRVIDLASSSTSYFNVYMFISQPGELSSSKFRFLNRLIQCYAVGMESTSLPIMLHMLLAAFVALRPKRNSWSKSRQSSLWEISNSNLKRLSLLIVLLLFARHLHSLYISQVWKLPDVSRIF